MTPHPQRRRRGEDRRAQIIDQALGTMQQRALVSTDEVADLLLDLRLLLASAAAAPVATGV